MPWRVEVRIDDEDQWQSCLDATDSEPLIRRTQGEALATIEMLEEEDARAGHPHQYRAVPIGEVGR